MRLHKIPLAPNCKKYQNNIKSMKLVKTADSTGHILCHDMTEIVPGKSKGTRFRRGHVIKPEDIPVLLDIGKEQLYVWETEQDTHGTSGMLHEEDGVERLCLFCRGEHIRAAPVREAKIELFAEKAGLLKLDAEKIIALNRIDGIAIITAANKKAVREGEKIAALKIIPLLIEEEKLKSAAGICGEEKPINIIPYKRKKAALVITGGEIFRKRIPDTGSEIIKKKLEAFGVESAGTKILPDDAEEISAAILALIKSGVELVICTGGMSVDPDDRTAQAIKKTGVRVISHGVPFLPGVMLLLAYYEKDGISVPVIGAPACVFYEKTTALDILLPRLLADDPVSREELACLGIGGLDT